MIRKKEKQKAVDKRGGGEGSGMGETGKNESGQKVEVEWLLRVPFRWAALDGLAGDPGHTGGKESIDPGI